MNKQAQLLKTDLEKRFGIFQNAKPGDADKRPIVHANSVRLLAKVSPATTYFTSPVEMEAEAEALLKQGEEGRKEVLSSSRILYEAVKEEDQQQIDLTGHLMRTVNGEIVPATEANKKALAQFESQFP